MPFDAFSRRHIGPSDSETKAMLGALGFSEVEQLISKTIPKNIRTKKPLAIAFGGREEVVLAELKKIASLNQVYRSYIGTGYYDTVTPGVILRNILENPGWYTAYTPYQPEISQGRMEALLNFQTMVSDLTGLPIANASLLDEGTAAAEAMTLCHAAKPKLSERSFFVADDCHPQTIAVVQTRAEALGIKVIVAPGKTFKDFSAVFGALVSYPATDGSVSDYTDFIKNVHTQDALAVVCADPLALTLLKSPGEMGADVAVGTTQRFGVPLGFGGPHAAYFATKDEYKRLMAGRLIGVSKDAQGKPALRLALQTREQHIRRAKATSNICTAQVLLAVIASMYAVYHGPEGLRRIAERVHGNTKILAAGLRKLGLKVENETFFDTLKVSGITGEILSRAEASRINFRKFTENIAGVSLDETVTFADLLALLKVFGGASASTLTIAALAKDAGVELPKASGDSTTETSESVRTPELSAPKSLTRKSAILTHPVFNRYHSETELLRYLKRLENKDISLTHSMIPLGSCTMKLNATAEMIPVTWPEFGSIHPFAPAAQTLGYKKLFEQLETWLSDITGFDAVSLQPNAGSQGEYAGLLAIRAFHRSRGEGARNVCLIPQSAHGTNPASAVLAGLEVVVVDCDERGNVKVEDLKLKAEAHKDKLAALMVTYPSTHGVFEEAIVEICEVIHKYGGQVYMDGANMNAQVGLCKPGEFGADVCHLNLHKTFCIPHGGGGPGMGPIGVKAHLKEFLPSHPVVALTSSTGASSAALKVVGPVSAAPWGSASILPISWVYIRLMGGEGLRRATEMAILNANYIAHRLDAFYPVLYKGSEGMVAHECIIDLRKLKAETGVEVDDVAKRLMDFGFHAPTMSFPVVGTMMIEPTESESKAELDRLCEALIAIYKEAQEIKAGLADRDNNVLKHAPHTAQALISDTWDRPYSREKAAFPAPWLRESKVWPSVSRVDNPYGDRNLLCTCPPLENYSS